MRLMRTSFSGRIRTLSQAVPSGVISSSRFPKRRPVRFCSIQGPFGSYGSGLLPRGDRQTFSGSFFNRMARRMAREMKSRIRSGSIRRPLPSVRKTKGLLSISAARMKTRSSTQTVSPRTSSGRKIRTITVTSKTGNRILRPNLSLWQGEASSG